MSKNDLHQKIIGKAKRICQEIGADNFEEAISFLEKNKKKNGDKNDF